MKSDQSYQKDTLLGPHVRAYLDSLHRRRQPRTIDSYEEALAYLCWEFQGKELNEITTDDLRAWIVHRWGHLKPATERQRTAAIKGFFRWADDDAGLLEGKDPARKLSPPALRPSDNEARRAVSPENMETLLRTQPKLRDRIAIQLLGDLGFRRNELRLFQLRHFTIETGSIRVQHGKGGKTRNLWTTARLQTDLEQYVNWEGHGPDEYLLYPRTLFRQPLAPTSVPYWWWRCLERAGLSDILLHELRYTAATRLYEDRKDLILVQRFLGHSNPKTTQGYLDLDPEGLREALRARR